jgi:hypothetical protein
VTGAAAIDTAACPFALQLPAAGARLSAVRAMAVNGLAQSEFGAMDTFAASAIHL